MAQLVLPTVYNSLIYTSILHDSNTFFVEMISPHYMPDENSKIASLKRKETRDQIPCCDEVSFIHR